MQRVDSCFSVFENKLEIENVNSQMQEELRFVQGNVKETESRIQEVSKDLYVLEDVDQMDVDTVELQK